MMVMNVTKALKKIFCIFKMIALNIILSKC